MISVISITSRMNIKTFLHDDKKYVSEVLLPEKKSRGRKKDKTSRFLSQSLLTWWRQIICFDAFFSLVCNVEIFKEAHVIVRNHKTIITTYEVKVKNSKMLEIIATKPSTVGKIRN